jgi:uncharacterized protein
VRDPETTDPWGRTHLHLAVAPFGGDLQAVCQLLADGADPNARTADGETVLDVLYAGVTAAGELLRAQSIEAALRAGGYRDNKFVCTADGRERTLEVSRDALRWHEPGRVVVEPRDDVARLGSLHPVSDDADDEVRRLWDGAEVPAPLERALRDLIVALDRDREAAATHALARGADANGRDRLGRPVLQHAASLGRTGIAKALLAAGATPSAGDSFGRTPLHEAVWRRVDAALVGELILAGADVSARRSGGDTPLHDAVSMTTPDPAAIDWLLMADADPNATDEAGVTPLMLARSVAAVSALVAAGATVDRIDRKGRTALMAAAGRGDKAVVRRLLEAGADAELRNRKGATARDYAAPHVVELLSD